MSLIQQQLERIEAKLDALIDALALDDEQHLNYDLDGNISQDVGEEDGELG